MTQLQGQISLPQQAVLTMGHHQAGSEGFSRVWVRW